MPNYSVQLPGVGQSNCGFLRSDRPCAWRNNYGKPMFLPGYITGINEER